MKYTNSHLKAAYGIYLIVLYIFIVFLIFGTFLLGFGFMKTKMQLDNVQPLENVLQEKSNHANKTAYIEIIQIPQKISEDKYESYYLVTTETNTYISGMQSEQFESLKHEIEQNGKARLEGMTKIIVDDKVKENVKQYIENEYIQIRVTKFTYGSILKEGYIVNLILGGITSLVSLLIIWKSVYTLGKYRNPKAKLIDEECNQKDAVWLNAYRIYLTKSFLITLYNESITEIDIETIREAKLFNKLKQNQTYRTLEITTFENETFVVSEILEQNSFMDEEEINYMDDIFRRKNIEFICEIKPYNYDEEEY